MAEIILGAVLILVTALLAEKASERWKAWLWALFVLLVIVQAGIQIRGRRAQDKAIEGSQNAQKELKDKLDTSLLNEKYTQGQLDTMNRVLGVIAANSDPRQTAALLKDLSGGARPRSTIKRDTRLLCSDLEKWQKDWLTVHPFPKPVDPQHPTAKENDAINTHFLEFSNEMFTRYGIRTLAIVQRYGAIGVDVRMMEQQLSYGSIPQDIVIKIKAFADRVNDDGTLKN